MKKPALHPDKISPFLWFDDQAAEAARFYTSIFKRSKILSSGPMMTTFLLEGRHFMALNGGPHFKFNEAISLLVHCTTQREVDYYWRRLSAGGEESRCGWLKDKFGLSWQIVPEILGELLGADDREKADRALQAMLKMRKLDIRRLKQAAAGR